jgi:hypothetical protein
MLLISNQIKPHIGGALCLQAALHRARRDSFAGAPSTTLPVGRLEIGVQNFHRDGIRLSAE